MKPVAVGLAHHEAGERQGEHAIKDMDADLLFGPMEHGRKGHDLGVFQLAEVALGRFLGAVIGDYGRGRGSPFVFVGEKDALAEQFVFEAVPRLGGGGPCQAQVCRLLADKGGRDDP